MALFLVAPAVVVFSVIALAWAIGTLAQPHRFYVPMSKGACPECGYAMAGLPRSRDGTIACPECGEQMWRGMGVGGEPAGWGWWSLAALVGVLAALPLIDVELGVWSLDVLHKGGINMVLLPPAAASFAGLVLTSTAIGMTPHVRPRERRWLLMTAAVLQVINSVCWVQWEMSAMASMG